jgi:hypothetical protein
MQAAEDGPGGDDPAETVDQEGFVRMTGSQH